MKDSSYTATIGRLFEAVRSLPESARRTHLLELGADPLQIAEVDALLVADAETSAWGDGQPQRVAEEASRNAELGAGDQLGSWRLLREIGTGGMGAVYLAERHDGHFDQQVAIKLIRGIPDSETFVHFARERQILANLQHPNIARLLDGGATPGGQPYLVMEHVEGVPIDRYCAEHKLDLAARLRLFQKVCDAVQFAHQRLVVHCDLKPSNVLVRADGTPVLLDFGISRALDQQPGQREASPVNAWITPLYASPEQLRGESVTTASDVFSLGLILFELLTGRRARVDADDHTITLLREAAVKPSELAKGMPWVSRLRGDLDAIVQRASAAQPAQRYESAESLSADLQRHLDLRPVMARAATTGYRMSRLARRRWPVVVAAVAVLALAAVFTWRIAAERDRALSAEREAVIQARTAERVSDFLVSVFNVSNPKLNQTRSITAREVLDEGAARIEGELSDSPKVKAKMLEVLGTAYRYIGESTPAVTLLSSAADLYLDPRVDQPLAAAKVLSSLAVVYSNNEYPSSKADEAAGQALRLREQYAQADSLLIADALNTLGIVRQAEGHFDEAEAYLSRSLAIRERLAGKESMQVATNLHNLGLVELNRGRDLAKSIAYFERSLALKRKLKGEHSPEFESTQTDLGKALRDSGQRARAVQILGESLILAHDLYGDSSELVANIHNELGYTYHDMGRFAEAADQYRASMEIRKKLGADQGASFAIPLNNLASAYEDMGDFAAAEPLFRRSLELRRNGLDADSPLIAKGEYNLARLLIKRGRFKEAGKLIPNALAIYRKRFGDDHRNVIRVELLDAERMLDEGNLVGAAAASEKILELPTKLGDIEIARRDLLIARIAAKQGDDKHALQASSSAWEAVRRGWGEHHPLTLEYGLAYAQQLRRNGDLEKAAAILQSVKNLAPEFSVGTPLRVELERSLREIDS
ncbi:MAG TPA: serine/threonine-protein kinase [Dokdonella sp.]|uniref:serine/threonine-protein kinase n=1 Tax=Dokdonella sp. TaxID=2291710 RepID=UPI002D80AEC4|nr:serine/threonine-protein kinase [Dokdonella sp.]HET9032201.1 serine/threonine-protein kinase [Dokdonella sp.]